MPTAGPGELIANLIGGDPTHQLAQSLAGPNPNPMAAPQQPGGAAPPPQAPSQAPAQATQSNPNTASLIEQLMRVHQRSQAVEGLNQAVEGFASRFGTAQQQASKVAALGRGGGADDPLAAIGASMKIQDAATTQQEHDAMMRDPEATGRMLGLPPGAGTAAANARVLPDLLKTYYGQQMGVGQTPIEKDLKQARIEWRARNPGKSDADMIAADPSLKDTISFEETKKGRIVTSQQTSKDLVADQHNYARAFDSIDRMIADAKQLKSEKGFADIYGNPLNAGKTLDGYTSAVLSDDTKRAIALYDKLMAGQYVAGVQDFHGAGRITQQELMRDAPSQSTFGKRSISVKDAQSGIDSWIDKMETKKANMAGQAGQLASLSDEEYAKVNPMYKPGGDAYVPGQPPRAETKQTDLPPDAKKAPDGHFYVPDPARPGKYLRVD